MPKPRHASLLQHYGKKGRARKRERGRRRRRRRRRRRGIREALWQMEKRKRRVVERDNDSEEGNEKCT